MGTNAEPDVDATRGRLSKRRALHVAGGSVRANAARGRSHSVQFHENDDALCEAIATFVAAGLAVGEPVMLITTPDHLKFLTGLFAARFIDVARAARVGLVVILDAKETLASLTVEGELCPNAFKSVIGTAVRCLRARNGNRPLRAFGEMVDLLWKAGRQSAAVRLEQLWNDLARDEEMSLICGYSLDGCDAHGRAELERIVDAHSHVHERRKTDPSAECEKLEGVVRELEAAIREKDELVATVSHDLRTPLNAILGWVRMLRADSLAETKRERALETIERNALAQAQLIEDLLDATRLVSNKRCLEAESMDLRSVIAKAMDAVKPDASAKSVTLDATLDPCAAGMIGDPGRIEQVVRALLTDAVKLANKSGHVALATRRFDSVIEIVVVADGEGIGRADHARQLVELHGGVVSVESEGRGEGTTIRVRLPVGSSQDVSTVRRISPRDNPRRGGTAAAIDGLRVLVVEDEPDARDVLVAMLTSYKATVITAESSAQALALVQEQQPDVIVSDIGMPGEDGYAFVRRLRALPASLGGNTPAIALTAFTRIEDRAKAVACGFDTHLPKPVDPAQIVGAIASFRGRADCLPR